MMLIMQPVDTMNHVGSKRPSAREIGVVPSVSNRSRYGFPSLYVYSVIIPMELVEMKASSAIVQS